MIKKFLTVPLEFDSVIASFQDELDNPSEEDVTGGLWGFPYSDYDDSDEYFDEDDIDEDL